MSYFGSWGIILDDVIFPDGRSAMGMLGGGGMYAASGMRIWCENVRLYAGVNQAFDATSLVEAGFTVDGLIRNDLPTPTAWQIFEENGRRTQISRVSQEAWQGQLVRIPVEHPVDPELRWAHFLGRGDPYETEWLAHLRSLGVRLSAEPIVDGNNTADELTAIRNYLKHFEIFSPGESEIHFLVGDRPVRDQLRALADLGPEIVALRQGAAGSIIYLREHNHFLQLPPAPATVVDVTGAGNAYCGGLLTGWVEDGDIIEAASRAAVSAAMTIEQRGPRPIKPETTAEARRRAEAMKPFIKTLE